MLAKHELGLLIVITVLLVGCSTTSPLTATAMDTVVPTVTQTAAPSATEPPTATSTAAPTATTKPTSTPAPIATTPPTSTAAPTETFAPAPTVTRRNTATPKPTKVVATATPTGAPVSSGVVPPPQVFQFDVGGFMKYLDYAHLRYQQLAGMIGLATRKTGSCREFAEFYNGILGIVAFADAPEPWTAMVEEYNTFRAQALSVVEPVNQVCKAGGGSVDDETDRKMLALLDRAQNRMYEMLQQAKTMTR
jgi:hypothetical protein